MFDIRAEEWVEPAFPLSGQRFDWSQIDQITMHYPGGGTPPSSGLSLQTNYVRAMQRSYVNSRGYSLGYNAVIFPDGTCFEVRGERFRCAANGNAANNVRAFAIQFAIAGDVEASPAATARARALVAEILARRPGAVVNRHSDVRDTACPGAGISRQVERGEFYPPPPVEPTPPTVEESPTMIKLDHRPDTPEWTALVFTGTHLGWVFNGHADGVLNRAGVAAETVSDAELDGIIASSTTTTECPSTFTGARRALWDSRRG